MVEALLAAPGSVQTLGNVVVHPLAAGQDQIGAGSWSFEFGWLVIGAGESVQLTPSGEGLVTATVAGEVQQTDGEGPGGQPELRNTGDQPALTLIASLDRTI
jgi:hypothetical protein